MLRLYVDVGRFAVKAIGRSEKERVTFRTYVAKLDESAKQRIWRYGNLPEGYIAYGGNVYAIGDTARRYRTEQRQAANRFASDYYMPLVLYALSKLYSPDNEKRYQFHLSHAPEDWIYADKITNLARGAHEFDTANGHYSITVIDNVETFDDTLGGYSLNVLKSDGSEYAKSPIEGKTILLLDVGGETTDFMAVDAGGIIDDENLKSRHVGALSVMERFYTMLRGKYMVELANASELDMLRVENAIRTNYYNYGKRQGKKGLACKYEAEMVLNEFTNDIMSVIDSAGGIVNYDEIWLTGGGAALVYDYLCRFLPDMVFVMVTKNRDDLSFANVLGGIRLFKMLERQ